MKKSNKYRVHPKRISDIAGEQEYCFWEQNDPIGKMKAAYGYDRDEWPDDPECTCKKCGGK